MVLGYYSIFPFFVCMALLLIAADAPWLRSADVPPIHEKKRVTTLDGLRGFLALAVVFHHVALYHGFLATGRWEQPPSFFYTRLGPLGVSLFFMITGFLFWSQLLRANGRLDWVKLYLGRLFRIGPLYLVAVLVMFLLVALATGPHLREPFGRLLAHIASWLALGAFTEAPLNGYQDPRYLLAGVTWTLRAEWAFYASLPLLALFTRGRKSHLRAALLALALTLALLHLPSVQGELRELLSRTSLFEMGMLSASLVYEGRVLRLPNWLGSAVALACLACFLLVQKPHVALNASLLLGLVFYLVVCGVDLFGLLRTRPALRLGDISYGLYLLQGLALDLFLRPGRALALRSPWWHWSLALLAAAVLIVLSAAAHAWVELPGIHLGKRIAKKLQTRPTIPASRAASAEAG